MPPGAWEHSPLVLGSPQERAQPGRGLQAALALLGLAALTAACGLFLSLPWWVFASVAGGLGLVGASLVRPKIGWCCLVAGYYVATPSIFFYPDGNIASIFLPHVLAPVVMLGTFLEAVAQRRSLRPGSGLMPLLLLTLGLQGLAWFWSRAPEFGLFNVGAMVANVLLFWCLVVQLRTVADLRLLCWALFVGGLVCGGGVVASQWWDSDYKFWFNRYWGLGFTVFAGRNGGFVASNHAAAYLFTAGCAAAALWVTAHHRLARLVLMLGAGFFLYAIVLTQSRGALMGMFAGAFAVIFLHPGLRQRFIRHALTFLVFVMCCVVIAEPGYLDRLLIGFGYSGELIFSEKPENANEEMENISGMAARFRMWKDALQVMQQEPETFLGGLGPGSFVHLTKEPEVHSLWLAFFFDLGLLGVALQVLIWIWLISHIRRLVRTPLPPDAAPYVWSLLVVCIGELGVHALIDHDLTSMVSRFSFLFFALTAGLVKVVDSLTLPGIQEGRHPCARETASG